MFLWSGTFNDEVFLGFQTIQKSNSIFDSELMLVFLKCEIKNFTNIFEITSKVQIVSDLCQCAILFDTTVAIAAATAVVATCTHIMNVTSTTHKAC